MKSLGIAAVAVLLVAGLAAAVAQFSWRNLNSTPSEASALEVELREKSQLFEVIAVEFPDEFDAILVAVTAAEERSVAAVTATSAQEVARVRLQNADLLFGADDGLLQALLVSAADTHRIVEETLGSEACGAFAMNGPAALGEGALEKPVLEALDLQGALVFRAMASGQGSEPRQPATDADWAATTDPAGMNADEQAMLQMVAAQDGTVEGYCPALVWFLERMAASEAEGAPRARATFAHQLATS